MQTRLSPDGAAIDMGPERGLVPNDYTNRLAMSAKIQALLSNPKLASRIDIGAGRYFLNAPLVTRAVCGGPVLCGASGPGQELTEEDYSVQILNPTNSRVGTQSKFIFVGTTGDIYTTSSCYIIQSMGSVTEKLDFMGRRSTTNFVYVGEKCDYGLVFADSLNTGVNTSKAVIRDCGFHQFEVAIYMPPIFQEDTIVLDGVIYSGFNNTFIKCDENQAIGLNLAGTLTIASDWPDFTAFDYSALHDNNSGGGIHAPGQVLFNRPGLLLKSGGANWSSGAFTFDHVRWDGATDNYLRGRAVLMTLARDLTFRANLDLAVSSQGHYRRPLVYQLGNSYRIHLRDRSGRVFHQADLDAWGFDHEKGERPSATDPCMSYVLGENPDAWWHFGDPTTYDPTPDVGDAVEVIEDKVADGNDLTQNTEANRMIYAADCVHGRPGLICDGVANRYYQLSSALGPGASELTIEFSGWVEHNGVNERAIYSCGHPTDNQHAVQLLVDATGKVFFGVSEAGSSYFEANINNDHTPRHQEPMYIVARFVGGTGGTGRLYLTVNGYTRWTAHSLAAINSSSRPAYVGITEYSGSLGRPFVGRMYDLKIQESVPSSGELVNRRDIICSQIGAPVDVPFTMAVSGATNATPIVVSTNTFHGLKSNRVVTIAGVGGNTAANGTFKITVPASATTYSTGTVSVTNGVVTLTGGQWPLWAEHGRITISSTGYEVRDRTSKTTLLLYNTSLTGVSGAAYSLAHLSTSTFSLQTAAGTDVAGSGAYTSGGTVTVA